MAMFVLSTFALAQEEVPTPKPAAKPFPAADFVLREKALKPQKSRVVTSPIETNSKGESTASFVVYGGVSDIQVGSLSFSADGKILAVGSTPGRVDLWDMENRKKIRTLKGGSTVALSPDGRLVAKDGKGIEICKVATGKLVRRIPWSLKSSTPHAQRTITQMEFNASGSLLLVTSNGDDDEVFDVASGRLIATLTDAREARFSPDGSIIVGGDNKHLIAWSTKDWAKLIDAPNGPAYVTQISAFPKHDLAVIGGPSNARLIHLTSGAEIAKLGRGNSIFSAFSKDGKLIFTYSSNGFAVWDTTGKEYCYKRHLGNGTVALSPDGRWLAAGIVDGGNNVAVWNLKTALAACGAPAP